MFIAFIFSNFLQAEIVSLLLQKPKTSLTRKNIGSKKLIGIAGFASSVKMAKLNWEASYTPPSWGSPKYLLWRTFKIKQDMDSYGKVLDAVTNKNISFVRVFRVAFFCAS